jgi:nitrogen fixation/metabolism regulation signal transduction histidine kinase
LDIVVTVAFVLYLVRKILKPILALTNVTSQAESGNLTLNKEIFNFKEILLEILSDFKQKIIESKKDKIGM